MEPNMPKNAIEAADNFLAARKRAVGCQCDPKKALSRFRGLCGASSYGRFSPYPTSRLRYLFSGMVQVGLFTMIFCLAVALLVLPGRVAAGDRHDDYAALLCKAIRRVAAESKLSPTQRYEDKYDGFSKAMDEAGRYYEKIDERGPHGEEGFLLSLLDNYRDVAAFWRACMNDRVFVKGRDKTGEPSYLVDRDPWPSWLEKRFPGLIGAIEEKGENGYYITGDKALDYIFRRLGRQVEALRCRSSR
jgi:hypothetical protein